MHDWSAWMLGVSFVSITALLLLYGLLQPWWRSWFGLAMVIVLFSLWQMIGRSLGILLLGWPATGDWIMAAGLTELAVGTTIAAIGLGRVLVRTWWAARGPETGPRAPIRVSRDS